MGGGNEDEVMAGNDRMIRDYIMPEDRSVMERTPDEIAAAPRALDPNGYKLKVMVYYDDLFAEEFGSKAVTRVEAVMAVVDEMYDEDDTFKTKLDVETVAIKHATGQNWGTSTNWGSDVLCRGCPTDTIASSSETEANLYVFLTGNGSKSGLGLAYLGSVCDTTRRRRTSINKYAAGSQKGGDAYTAETVAHEMGHNLGLAHDCLNGNCAYWSNSYKGPRVQDGKECFGYMDYKDDTNYWSACSVSDFTAYINQQQQFCLPLLKPAPSNDICKTIKVTTKKWGYEISWTFGPKCTSLEPKIKYASNAEATPYECCQPAGEYELDCQDSYGDGWHGGYIEIGGQKYCEDFTSGQSKNQTISFQA